MDNCRNKAKKNFPFLRIVRLGIAVLVLGGWGGTAHADWEDSLKAAFPQAKVVETFDNLQDWHREKFAVNDYHYCPDYDSTCPKNADGSLSKWRYYTNKAATFEFSESVGSFAIGDQITGLTSGSAATIAQIWDIGGKRYIQPTSASNAQAMEFEPGETIQTAGGAKVGTMVAWPNFIANHGTDWVWRGEGKSLAMDLGDNDTPDVAMAGLGAQRLGVYFGDEGAVNGKTGLKKVHLFLMMKIRPTYFPLCQTGDVGCVAGNYRSLQVIKWFDFCSGFTDIDFWGTPEENAKGTPLNLAEYGLNDSIFNVYGGGLSYPNSIFIQEATNVLKVDGPTSWSYQRAIDPFDGSPVDPRRFFYVKANDNVTGSTYLTPFYQNEQWFGMEVAYDIGTPGNNDGTVDFWLYDASGNEVGHYWRTGQNHMAPEVDHYYNKITLGGNRRAVGTLSTANDGRFYYDDVIISGDRIGPSYFAALAAYNNPPATYTIADFLSLVAAWLTNNASSDKNSDNIVNTRDLGIIMSNWE